MKLIGLPVAFGLVITLTGCGGFLQTAMPTYPDIKPEYPLPFVANYSSADLNVDATVTVDSLTPTLRWAPQTGVQKYDVAVWTCPSRYLTGQFEQELGDQVFFTKEIRGLSVRITPALKPGIRYYWSVRPSGTEKWSTYNIHDYFKHAVLDRSSSSYNLHFKFRTPKGKS